MQCQSINYITKPHYYTKISEKPDFKINPVSWEKSLKRNKIRNRLFDNFILSVRIDEIEIEFITLAEKWKEETGAYSTSRQITSNQHYLEIIGMGKAVVPYILKELKEEPDLWFTALRSINRFSPINNEDYGDIEKMTEAWINWGVEKGLIG